MTDRPKAWRTGKPMAYLLLVGGAVGLMFLYCHSPQDFSFFPRCPFLVLTGYKCPGCGTLRALHALLHFRFADAFAFNPLLVVSLPVLIGLLAVRRVAFNPFFGKCILAVTLAYWIARNLMGF